MSANQYAVEILCPDDGFLRKANYYVGDAVNRAENEEDGVTWYPPPGTQIQVKKASDCARQCGSHKLWKLQETNERLEAKVSLLCFAFH